MCAHTVWHTNKRHFILGSKSIAILCVPGAFPSKNLSSLRKHLETALQKYQKIHRNQDREVKQAIRANSLPDELLAFILDLQLSNYQPQDRSLPHPPKANPRKVPHKKSELEISAT